MIDRSSVKYGANVLEYRFWYCAFVMRKLVNGLISHPEQINVQT